MGHFDTGKAMRNQAKLAKARRNDSKARADRVREHRGTEHVEPTDFGDCSDCGTHAPLLNMGDRWICDTCSDQASVERHMGEGLWSVGSQALGLTAAAVLGVAALLVWLPGAMYFSMPVVVLAITAGGFGWRAWRSVAALSHTQGLIDISPGLLWFVRLSALLSMLMAVLVTLTVLVDAFLPTILAYMG